MAAYGRLLHLGVAALAVLFVMAELVPRLAVILASIAQRLSMVSI